MSAEEILLNLPTHAAVQDRPDPRRYLLNPKEIGQAPTPFDWERGYDVEAEIGKKLGKPFKFHVKDQGPSASCGGQSTAYHMAALAALHDGDTAERSAKFIYSQVYYPYGGGSTLYDLGNLVTKQGAGTEADTTSYDQGKAPSEAFMQRPQDITEGARTKAKLDKALSYAAVALDIDSLAAALPVSGGIRIGIHGTNNGTWLSDQPKPPKVGEKTWAHFVYIGKAFIENGVKKIAALNSWGEDAGDKGWQKLDASYIASGALWGAQALVYNPNPATGVHYTFNADLEYGQTATEINMLQRALQQDGSFPAGIVPTQYYGEITRQAVLKFQQKYKVAPTAELAQVNGRRVGAKTRAKLNELFA